MKGKNIKEVKMAKNNLITLDHYNLSRIDYYNKAKMSGLKNGIECPKCKNELSDEVGALLCGLPAQIKVYCETPGCNFVSSRIV